jgi:hypothetical protein
VARLGARQRLVVSRRQLLALDATGRSIECAVRRRRLHRYHHGVYALVEISALPALAAEQAALLACGPRTVISHRSGAQIWGLVDIRPGPVSVTVPGSDAGRRRFGIDAHTTTVLDAADVRRRQGLLVTAPARTLIDLAGQSTPRQVELALDRAIARGLTSRTAVRAAVARCPTRAGVALVRSLLGPERPSSVTASDPEERLLALIRRAQLPEPEVDVPLGDPHSAVQLERYRPDLLWRRQRVVVEFDSWLHHSGRRAFRYDRRRDAAMRLAGWIVLRFTEEDLTEEPERVVAWIATALARSITAAA